MPIAPEGQSKTSRSGDSPVAHSVGGDRRWDGEWPSIDVGGDYPPGFTSRDLAYTARPAARASAIDAKIHW